MDLGYIFGYIFKSKRTKRFAKLDQTMNRKDALEYIVHAKNITMDKLNKKIHTDLIEEFEATGYRTI